MSRGSNRMSSFHNLTRILWHRRIIENHGDGDDEEEEEERESESSSAATPASATPDIGEEFFEDLEERASELQDEEDV